MQGAKRVAAFCCLTAILPTILIILPLYLRHVTFADVIYEVAESDIVAIVDGFSPIFCQSHSLKMNLPFNAFQLRGTPQFSEKLKHIRLKKSMSLPDDTFEYWGFFLLQGAVVKVRVCSRFQGSRILVVRGEKNLKTCGLLNKERPIGTKLDSKSNKVKVTFENQAEQLGAVDEDVLKEDTSAEDLREEREMVDNYVKNRLNKGRLRLQKLNTYNETKKKLNFNVLYNDQNKTLNRTRRVSVGTFDQHIAHGGTAHNAGILESEEDSVSSFETDLLSCFNGQILLAQEFLPSHNCDINYLENNRTYMQTLHEVDKSGYYYYIFYSDNDVIVNDIHAIFDIYKPSYYFANSTDGVYCLNKTNCTFPVAFFSDETVIVEVPTRDGIEHEGDDDITLLYSKCNPRMAVYMIFPILVLFLILGCAFL